MYHVAPHLGPVLAELDRERRSSFPSGVIGEILPSITRLHGVAGEWHQVAYSALTAEDADVVIERQVAHYRALGTGFEWAAYAHDAPRDLVVRLERRGFAVGAREAVVVLDGRLRPAWLGAPAAYRIEAVHTRRELALFAGVAERIFGSDQTGVIRELEARLAEGSAEHVAYLGYVDGEVAGVARLQTHRASQFAGLYGGGTLQRFRGRGVYRAMVARRALEAIRAGTRYLRVDALPTSQPILEALGFEVLTYLWPCVFVE